MCVTHRRGRWTLDRKTDGVYLIKRRGRLRAAVVTDAFDPAAGSDVSYLLHGETDVLEVATADDVEVRFRAFADGTAR